MMFLEQNPLGFHPYLPMSIIMHTPNLPLKCEIRLAQVLRIPQTLEFM